MKLSYKAEYQKPVNAPISNWEPVDFLSKSLVDLSQNQEPVNPEQPVVKGKSVRSLLDVIALLKLPINDADRYKKIINSKEFDKYATPWIPKDISTSEDDMELVLFPGIGHPGRQELSPEEVSRRSEVLQNIDQKLSESEEKIHQAQIEAESIIKQANEQKNQIIAEAEGTAQQIKQRAYDEGLLSVKTENERQAQQIVTIIKETQNWQARVWEQSEDNIIKMIQTIAHKLFGSGFSLDATSIEQMVGRAINEANRLGNLRIYVNPEDHNLLISLWQESDLVVNGQKISLVPSQNIQRGGCFVEGDFGSVDSRIDVQLELLENELNNTLTNRNQEKQRQNSIGGLEPNLSEKTSGGLPGLSDLDDNQTEIKETIPQPNKPLEDHGNDIPAQPE